MARAVRLPDGRTLSFYELGDPRGAPVLLCHGIPSSAAGWLPLDGPAREVGVRGIALDRPGIGGSSPRRRRSVADWAGDAAAAADALGLGRFAVLGWSGGGPYALACAALLPGRVSACATAGCPAPSSWPGAASALSLDDRLLGVLAVHAPTLARTALAGAAILARRAPRAALASFRLALPEPDRRALALAGAGPRAALRSFTEALRQGPRGVVADYAAHELPWGFRLDEVRMRVVLWHGCRDTLVGPLHARLLAARLPDAEVRLLEPDGHLLPLTRGAELLRALVYPVGVE